MGMDVVARLRGWLAWLERVDPGTNRRVKGLRLVTAYGIAAMLGALLGRSYGISGGTSLSFLAGGYALWASIYEGQTTRARSSLDLLWFNLAAVAGTASVVLLAPLLRAPGWPGAEAVLVPGAFLVGYLKRYGVTGAGIGSQIYIGQLLAFSISLRPGDLALVLAAGVVAAIGSIVPRVLSGPAEKPVLAVDDGAAAVIGPFIVSPELLMGVQAAVAAIVIIAINDHFGLVESVWAITACTYVVASSTAGTILRIRHRIIGTALGVPLGIALVPLVPHAEILIWLLAALAMVIYAISFPERYDIACGAYAFTLIVTLAVDGESSLIVLASRLWETLLGGVLGLGIALFLVPIRKVQKR